MNQAPPNRIDITREVESDLLTILKGSVDGLCLGFEIALENDTSITSIDGEVIFTVYTSPTNGQQFSQKFTSEYRTREEQP